MSGESSLGKASLKMMCQVVGEVEYYRKLYYTVVPVDCRAPIFSQLSRRSG